MLSDCSSTEMHLNFCSVTVDDEIDHADCACGTALKASQLTVEPLTEYIFFV